MLAMSILRPDSQKQLGAVWRDYLVKNPPVNNAYTLYYAIRVLLALDGKVPDSFRGVLDDLAKGQRTKGASAGLIPLERDAQMGRYGAVISTAGSRRLILEHSPLPPLKCREQVARATCSLHFSIGPWDVSRERSTQARLRCARPGAHEGTPEAAMPYLDRAANSR